MRIAAVFLAGLVLIGASVMSLTAVGASPVDQVRPVTVRADSVYVGGGGYRTTGSRSYGSRSRYSSGGGYRSGK